MGNYRIDLCPVVNRHIGIGKSEDRLPAVSGYEVPLQSTSCELVPFAGWKIPLKKPGLCSKILDLRWEQETCGVHTFIGTTQQPTNYWLFSCTPPRGLFEGTCTQCFPRAAVVYLVGNLGFSAGTLITYGRRLVWRVHRDDLPFPGELILALAFTSEGEGDAFIAQGSCAYPQCGTPHGDCIWGRRVSLITSGTYLVIASNFFATPTWTGGVLEDYYTDTLGWVGVPLGNLSFPNCDVYGDPSLQYKIRVEGELRIVTSMGFAGYGIGTHVLLKKVGPRYSEPFSDSCLGISEGVPEEFIEYEKIGVSDGTFSPSLSALSKPPFNLAESITIFTNYSVYTVSGSYDVRYLSVGVSPTDGVCSGDCAGGILNLRTGEWKEDIYWTHIPNADGCNEDPNVRCQIEIVAQYTKAEESCVGVAIAPWHVMGVGG